MYKVYVIYSSNFERYYVGITEDIEVRLKQHNSGKTKSTKAYVPWEVVLTEDYETRLAARNREKYLKSAAGRRWRKINVRPRGATE
ncbi:MAG: GIY-YIG nuclease family protein [Melioribacteraceae bacterium]|nr:GIY-YIG nuclease family protein [Melioribacteraceae bacterium]